MIEVVALHSSVKLEKLTRAFDEVFLPLMGTRLIGGFEEPMYVPGNGTLPAEIRFTRDYIRSALHEVAHWCIAGPERLKLVDYGYWYRPDGRSPAEQKEFFKFEVKPQALEWMFSKRCGVTFQVSVDNLDAEISKPADLAEFELNVARQLALFENDGLPPRARIFLDQVLATRDLYTAPFCG